MGFIFDTENVLYLSLDYTNKIVNLLIEKKLGKDVEENLFREKVKFCMFLEDNFEFETEVPLYRRFEPQEGIDTGMRNFINKKRKKRE
jgi:hypothetical protein